VSEAKTTEQLLQNGRELAALIETQTERCTHALQNREEFRRLEQLQTKWQAWEQQAVAAGIDMEKEFGKQKLELLRPVAVKVSPFPRQRRTLNAYELHVLGSRPERNQEKPKDPNMPLSDWP
jgi:hypothetical protein